MYVPLVAASDPQSNAARIVLAALAAGQFVTPPEEGVTLDKVGAALSALGLGLIVYGLLRSGTWGFIELKPTAPVLARVSPAIVEESTAARVRALQVSFGLLALFAVAALPVAGRLPRTPAVSKRPDPAPSPTR